MNFCVNKIHLIITRVLHLVSNPFSLLTLAFRLQRRRCARCLRPLAQTRLIWSCLGSTPRTEPRQDDSDLCVNSSSPRLVVWLVSIELLLSFYSCSVSLERKRLLFPDLIFERICGRDSTVGTATDWWSGGCGFDPRKDRRGNVPLQS